METGGMNERMKPRAGDLVPSGGQELTIPSAPLAKRGLDMLRAQEARTVRFAEDRSSGALFACSMDWKIEPYLRLYMDTGEEIGEARGTVTVPPGVGLSLRGNWEVQQTPDLSPLAALDANDLQEIQLSDTDVTDADLAHLRGLSGLRLLSLGSQITDAGLAYLSSLTGLYILDLDFTQITDAGLAHLQGLANLKSLELSETQITDAGLAELRRALPQCEIDVGTVFN